MIMRGAVAARKLGVFERYVDEVYRHMWADPKKLDDPSVLRAALIESELPADRLFELVQTAEVKDALLAETQRAVERGTFGSPTFFVDGEIYFGKDRLRDVEEAIAAAR
jgi:2-hydroxychromene-2-carboxylate isomerase